MKGKRPADRRAHATAQVGENDRVYEKLLKLVHDNPERLLKVAEVRLYFHIPVQTMTQLRTLAAKDPESDPWIGDQTAVPQFSEWLWKKRRLLEMKSR